VDECNRDFHEFIMETQLIRHAEPCDAQNISEIYNGYILHTTATFETEAIDELEMRRRILEKLSSHDWLVAEVSGRIVGYAYYGPFRPRPAYAQTAESTIYLSERSVGKGLGTLLYSQLIDSAAEKGFRELIGYCTPERGKREASREIGVSRGRPPGRGGPKIRKLHRCDSVAKTSLERTAEWFLH